MPLDPEQIIALQNSGKANYQLSPSGVSSMVGNSVGSLMNGLFGGGGQSSPTQTSSSNDLLSQLLASLGSSGGSSSPDHFFDINPLDQSIFDANQKQQGWKNDFDTAQFNWQKAQDDRDYALALGDLDLARQKQADSNYWQSKSYELSQQQMASSERMNAADNAARISASRISAEAQTASAQIAAMADRYAADQRLREGLANAKNDEERNRIALAHEREIAAIAKMEDDTKRAIAAGEQKIGGFNAETARMAQMGDVALKNNQFLLDASKSPRDLFGLYFMQRGVTPDWNGLAAGNVTQGDPLKVYDPMKAYTPNITMPQDFTINPGQSYGQVGQASQMELNPNTYITGQQQSTPTKSNGPAIMTAIPHFAGGTDPMQPQPIDTKWNPTANTGVQNVPVTGNFDFPDVYKNPQIDQNTPGFTTAPKFMTGDAPSPNPWSGGAKPEIIENPTNAPIRVKNTTQSALDYGITLPFSDTNNGRSKFARQLPINIQHGNVPIQPMAFDQEVPFNPMSEMVDPIRSGLVNYNPTGFSPAGNIGNAQPFVTPGLSMDNPVQLARNIESSSQQNKADFPIQTGNLNNTPGNMQDQSYMIGRNFMPQGVPDWLIKANLMGGAARPAYPSLIGDITENKQNNSADIVRKMFQSLFGTNIGMPRYSVGTDVSQQYNNLGMSQLWQNSSNNDYLQGKEYIPDWIKTLADYGAPVSPGLYDAVSGGISPTLNLANAFGKRGGGILPSLQGLNKMSSGEQQLFSGYVDGPVGMPSMDVFDFIGRPTQNLRTATRSNMMM